MTNTEREREREREREDKDNVCEWDSVKEGQAS